MDDLRDSGLPRNGRSGWFVLRRGVLFALLMLLPLLSAVVPVPTAAPAATAPVAPVASKSAPPATAPLRPYVLRVAPGNTLVVADGNILSLASKARTARHDELAPVLAAMALQSSAGPATYDAATEEYRVSLTDAGRAQLLQRPLVASIDPAPPATTTVASLPKIGSVAPTSTNSPQSLSIDYVQVYSPFMWGTAKSGGYSVKLTLLDSTGMITVGVPVQTFYSTPNIVQIDRSQLYYETIFVDPNNQNTSVMILPGEKVHVVTTDSSVPPIIEDKLIIVDDVRASSSFATGTVSGTAPPNTAMVVTVSNGFPGLSNYITPGASATYADLTSGADGTFSVSSFKSSLTGPYGPVTMTPGWAGFVRVKHANGDEVFTFHGQNIRILENSYRLHGWFFGTPGAPPNLEAGIRVNSRPDPLVAITLTDPQGHQKSTVTASVSGLPYTFVLGATISGGDVLTITLNGVLTTTVATTALVATADPVASTVTGTGPPSTPIVIAAGQIDGFMMQSSIFTFIKKSVPSDGSGKFGSGAIQCGSGGFLSIVPGSFGYVGYEDPRGNFIYLDYAAPRNDVFSGFPYVEGYVANSLVQPIVTVTDLQGGTSVAPATFPLYFLDGESVYFYNVYYYAVTSQFLDPGFGVTVNSGATTHTIVVDRITANADVDANSISGKGPAGAALVVIPSSNSYASRAVTADGSGNWVAVNQYTAYSSGSCTSSMTNITVSTGSSGRVYLTHPDGSKVFGEWGRWLSINENDNLVEGYLYPTWDLGMVPPTSSRTATFTLSPVGGPVSTLTCPTIWPDATCLVVGGLSTDTKAYFWDSLGTTKVLIRAGASIGVTYMEGIGAVQRPTTMGMSNIPAVFLRPDLSSSTVGGVAPADWVATAFLTSPPAPGANPIVLKARPTTAINPFGFLDGSNKPIQLFQDYSGIIKSSDTVGNQVWSAWAITGYLVKITGILMPGITTVCGTASPSNSVTVFDASSAYPPWPSLGSGPTDSLGAFCVTVSPPLTLNQTIVVEDSFGTMSQAAEVGRVPPGFVFLPFIAR